MDKTLIESIMGNIGVTSDAETILAMVQEHPKYKQMNDEHGPDETIQAITEDHPRLFEQIGPVIPPFGSEKDQAQDKPKKKSRYFPGKQKHNNGTGYRTGADRERGVARAYDRHVKRKSI